MTEAASRPRRRRARGAAAPLPTLPDDAMQRRARRLSAAVRDRRVLELLYAGAWRVVHPHALGRTGTGRLGLLCWQTAGAARPNRYGEGWRLFDVARIDDARALHASFTPRPRPASRAGASGWTAGIVAPTAEVPPRDAFSAPLAA